MGARSTDPAHFPVPVGPPAQGTVRLPSELLSRWAREADLLGCGARCASPQALATSRTTWRGRCRPTTSASGSCRRRTGGCGPCCPRSGRWPSRGASRWAAWLPRPRGAGPGDSEGLGLPRGTRRQPCSQHLGPSRQVALAVPAVKPPTIQPSMRVSMCPPAPSPLQPFEPLFQVHQEPHPKANLPMLKS